MSLHRLRVINFDRISSEKNAPVENSSTFKHKSGENNKKRITSHQSIRNNTSEECGDGFQSSEKRNVFNQPLNNIILNGPLIRNESKKYLRKNTSFVLLKRKNKWKNKKINSAVFPLSYEWPVKNSLGRVENIKYTTKRKYENHETDNDIQILFTNQTFKGSNAPRNWVNKNRITRRRSKSIYDVFDFQTNNHSFDSRCKYNKSRNRNFGQKKTVRWKTSKKPFICCRKFLPSKDVKPSCLRNIKSDVQKTSTINFSNSYEASLNKKSLGKTHCNETLPDKFLSNDPQVSITSPCLHNSVKYLVDAAASTSRNVKSTYKRSHSNIENPKCSYEKDREFNTTLTNHRINIINKTVPFAIQISKMFLTYGESVVKTILISFIFIAWLPCIIVILTCWILTYPFRPQFTVTDVLISIQEFCTSTCDSCRTCVASIFNFIRGILRKTFCLGQGTVRSNQNYVKRTLHRQTTHQYSCNLNNKRKHPNPRRKYTLFYTKNKGWLMKPIPQRLVDKRTYIAQTLRHLFRQNSKENKKNGIKKTILISHGPHNECRCLYTTKKVKIHMPTDNADNIPHSAQNENHTKQIQVLNPNFTRGTQYFPLKTLNKSSEYHQRCRSMSYHHSLKPNSPIGKHLPYNSSSLQNAYKHSHQHTLPVTRPPQNYFRRLPSVGYKTIKSHPQEPQIFQPLHHDMLLPLSRMRQPILPSTNHLSSKFTNSCTCYLPDEQYRALKVCNRHRCNSLHAHKNCIPTQIISVSKNTPCNMDPCILKFLKYYANNRRNKKYSKIKQKINCFCKQSCRKLNAIAEDADARIWSGDDLCNFYNVKSKKKPRNKFLRCCSSLYTCFSNVYKCIRKVCYILLYLITVCVWCPIFCCTYICYELICQSTKY